MQTVAVLSIFLAVGIGGYVELSNHIAPQAASAQVTLAGQLTEFIKIENDLLTNINANDFASAKKGADDLEHQWDVAEPMLRKIDGTTWTRLMKRLTLYWQLYVQETLMPASANLRLLILLAS